MIESISKSIAEDSESMLMTNISDIKVDTEREETFYCGIDCGSTQTRIILVPESKVANPDLEEWFKVYAVIPSKSKNVEISEKLKPRSNLLFDNMDSVFSINAGQTVRLVRGAKINDVEIAEKELIASSKKVTSETLRYNIVDAIGYNLVQYYTKLDQDIPGNIKILLSIALPPDDLLDKDIEILRSQLSRFSWSLVGRMGGHIEVSITSLAAYSEPEAQATAYYLFAEGDVPEEVLLLESGGRNSAPVILVNGNPIGAVLKSIDQSGSKLLDKIGTAYVREYGGRMPSIRHLENAVKTGKIKTGNTYMDITPIIKSCKDQVAEDLYQRLLSEVLSKQTVVSLETLNEILLSGRVFLEGDYNYSVASKFTSLVLQASPHTVVKVIQKNMIPQGLILLYLYEKVFNVKE
jgi:hypothetical protein